jgi:hypothetical protein
MNKTIWRVPSGFHWLPTWEILVFLDTFFGWYSRTFKKFYSNALNSQIE